MDNLVFFEDKLPPLRNFIAFNKEIA